MEEKDIDAPTPPKRRSSIADMIQTPVLNMPDIHPPFENAWSKIERNGDDYLLHGNIKVLKQHQPELMDAFAIVFRPDFEPSAFHADCRITANELPTPIEQPLHFAYQPESASSH